METCLEEACAALARHDESQGGWFEEEMAGLALPDQRLNRRLLVTGQHLAARPTAGLPQALGDWATYQGALRLFHNPRMSPEALLRPHIQRTQERARGLPLVLAIQDTTTLDYKHHPKKQGLGPVGTAQAPGYGLLAHTTLLVTPTGLPLGLLHWQVWARSDEEQEDTADLSPQEQRLREKESVKWLHSLEATVALLPPERVVTVSDRESDFYGLFHRAQQLGTHLLVRAAQDRRVMAADGEGGRLWEAVEQVPVAGFMTVEVQATEKRKARQARVSIRYASVQLCPPKNRPGQGDPILLWAILLREEEPPEGEVGLEWLLLTTVPVETLADAKERVRWYELRWQVEVFHKIWKSGCRIEAVRLRARKALENYLSLMAIIAWRLLWLTWVARERPDAPATEVLTPEEWQALYMFLHPKGSLPQTVPTAQEVIAWIARLGGHLGRRGDRPPGVTVLWRGWQRLADITAAWIAFRESCV